MFIERAKSRRVRAFSGPFSFPAHVAEISAAYGVVDRHAFSGLQGELSFKELFVVEHGPHAKGRVLWIVFEVRCAIMLERSVCGHESHHALAPLSSVVNADHCRARSPRRSA